MKYYRIDVRTTSQGIEIITAKLMLHGIENTAVENACDLEDIMMGKSVYGRDYIEDSLIEQMNEAPKITVYAKEYPEVEIVMRALHELSVEVRDGVFGETIDIGSLKPEIAIIDDADWKDKWKEYFKPFRVSDHVIIKPTWENCPRLDPEDIIIEIDPGMAFGTGAHETTSMCIEMLEKYIDPGDSVLDAGCGSGILAVTAAKLGAGRVLGIDIDETAVSVAQENILLNDVSGIAKAEYGDIGGNVDFVGNTVVANLTAELICGICGNIPKHLEKDGIYIVSGILTEKKDMVLEALSDAGFLTVEIYEKGEWCCMVAKKGVDVR